MFTSVRGRLLASYLALTAIVLVLAGIGFFVLLSSNPAASRLVYERLEAISALALRAERAQGQGQARALRAAIEQLGRRTGANGMIIDRQGNIRVAGFPDDVAVGPQVVEVLTSLTAPERGSFQSEDGRTWLYVARPVGEGASLIVFAPEPNVRLIPFFVGEFLPTLVRAGILALLGSLVLAFFMERWIASPLRGISSAADQVVGGQFPDAINPRGPVEVRTLAAAFNRMLERVSSSQQAMKDFVANLSHELKTPLTSIQGFAQAIMDGTVSDEQQRVEAARVIHEEAQRLQRLAEELLDLARLDAGEGGLEFSPVELPELLNSVRAKMQPAAAARQVELALEPGPGINIMADQDRLAQVLINLLDNAIQHSQPGGTVGLSIEREPGTVKVHVEDQGPGLEAHDIERIFERFYRLDRSRAAGPQRGVGLGLSIARQIVRAHGGQIQVQSEVGRGSKFTVVLPAARPEDSTLSRKGR